MAKQALEGKRLNAFAMDPTELVIVGLDTEDGPEHPLYDERIKLKVNQALIANVRTYGVIEPVIVTKDGDNVLVIDGRQRVRAARAANDELTAAGCECVLVPTMLRKGAEESLMGVMISANENRVGDELLVKLNKLEKLMGYGRTEEEAAVTFGVSTQTVRNWLKLASASNELKKAVGNGQISPSAAVQLAKLSRADQATALQEALQNAKEGKKVSVENAARLQKQRAQPTERVIVPPSKKRLKELRSTELPQVNWGSNYTRGFLAALDYVLGQKSEEDLGLFSADEKVAEE